MGIIIWISGEWLIKNRSVKLRWGFIIYIFIKNI